MENNSGLADPFKDLKEIVHRASELTSAEAERRHLPWMRLFIVELDTFERSLLTPGVEKLLGEEAYEVQEKKFMRFKDRCYKLYFEKYKRMSSSPSTALQHELVKKLGSMIPKLPPPS